MAGEVSAEQAWGLGSNAPPAPVFVVPGCRLCGVDPDDECLMDCPSRGYPPTCQ